MVIYCVTAVTRLKEMADGFTDYSARCFGYKETFEQADNALAQNVCNIHETIYNYAVVEKITPGIHGDVDEVQWYVFDDKMDGYVHCDKPAELKGFCYFSGIG